MAANRISFFIPAYNCAATIAESVASIMADNFTDGDELIIVNDYSTDNTAQVLAELQSKYPTIKVIAHKRNKGGSAARNTAVENAGHDLLFCLDSDNVLAPGSIALLKTYLLNNNADIAAFQHQHFFKDDKTKPHYIWSIPPGELPLESYLRRDNTPGQHGNYLFTKQSWVNAKGYAEGIGALDTWSFGLRQAITGAKTMILRDTFYYHRLSDDSYWMRENETKLWANSTRATTALFPFFDIIDEGFIEYMLGKGKYTWFYTMQSKPLKLVPEGSKQAYYEDLQQRTHNFIYPKPTLTARIVNKLKRMLNISK
ncbi:glycosyltransferase family 2 protein [Mucilaginibacter myungsuensis]|uniref:Glycosyltransferase family 2 protein n=1 Tax=Mucilaginibacter myungsuensis TaxID=649104 RepID=A0A929KTE0_9SPHI|nr:glycosyltransferase family 2 protein [Mucilaginibacter myungsuensis]MBE9660822.1 glycosyltransferase family 2 protein [Mucilaginibacter myungsuensis]MDN3600869.1 glycosyltransferase family 2 protein [Mucilaginibacter myungsuensis]